ncbi:MAG TPA: LysE family transporter [Candidatus Sumerlaeota bacterium]|nr:LysE family transporter [Candidatus Sumerlaeota bacterium]
MNEPCGDYPEWTAPTAVGENGAVSDKRPGIRPFWRIGRLGALAFVTGFSGAVMPGSLLAVTIEQTLVQGFRAVLGILAGHALLELVLVALLVLGLRSVLERPRVRGCIGIVGGLALLWMGWDMVRHVAGMSLSLSAGHREAYSFLKLILAGACVSAANPYFTGWWATIGVGQLAQLAPRTPLEYLVFYLGHEGADFAWYGFVGVLLITGRRVFTDWMYQGLILFCGAAILALGVWFLVSGVRLWRQARASKA